MTTDFLDDVYGSGEYKHPTPNELISWIIAAGVKLRIKKGRVRVIGRKPIPPGFLLSWHWYRYSRHPQLVYALKRWTFTARVNTNTPACSDRIGDVH